MLYVSFLLLLLSVPSQLQPQILKALSFVLPFVEEGDMQEALLNTDISSISQANLFVY